MKKITLIIIPVIIIITFLSFFFLTRNKKVVDTPIKTTQKSKQIELADNEKPYISLIPRSDGHELNLKVENIPLKFSNAEYELIYTAEDEGLKIEKGIGGSVEIEKNYFERKLLLGTESCTNGCKYKYDEGITGGVLTLTLTTIDKEYFTFETSFVLKNSAQINKEKTISLSQEKIDINATVTSKSDFFVLIKNIKNIYSVFSSGKGAGKIISIEPKNITKDNLNFLVGDYLIQ